MTSYIYAEPDPAETTVYLDQTGKPHLTRDSAITANISQDLNRALLVAMVEIIPDHHHARTRIARLIVDTLRDRDSKTRDMVRNLIESTD